MAVSNSFSSRPQTPIIYQSPVSEKSGSILVSIRNCFCSNLVVGDQAHILSHATLNNSQITFCYKKKKYKAFPPARGAFYVVSIKEESGRERLVLVRDKQVSNFPCCDKSLYSSPYII